MKKPLISVTASPCKKKKERKKSSASNAFTPPQSILPVPERRRGRRPALKGIPDPEPSRFPLDLFKRVKIHAELGIDQPNSDDIYHYFKSMETMPKYRPLESYLQIVQNAVTADMRAWVINCLARVSHRCFLSTESLCHSVSFLDLFLSCNLVSYREFYLLGLSAMRLATQYDERFPPTFISFKVHYGSLPQPCYEEEVTSMQYRIFEFLDYEIGNPTTITFVRIFVRAESDDINKNNLVLECLGCYLAELSLLDYTLIKYLPSLVAAAVVFLARFVLNPDLHPWNKQMQERTGYKVSLLKDCIYAIHDLTLDTERPSSAQIRKKYTDYVTDTLSMIVPPYEIPEIPAMYLEDIIE